METLKIVEYWSNNKVNEFLMEIIKSDRTNWHRQIYDDGEWNYTLFLLCLRFWWIEEPMVTEMFKVMEEKNICP